MKLLTPKSIEATEFHDSQAAYHRRQAEKHRGLGEIQAEQLHLAGVAAHKRQQVRRWSRALPGWQCGPARWQTRERSRRCATVAGADMTPAEAQALRDRARAGNQWLVWFIGTNPAHPGKVVAWAVTANQHGGGRHPDMLIADTLDKLRAMLPTGPLLPG